MNLAHTIQDAVRLELRRELRTRPRPTYGEVVATSPLQIRFAGTPAAHGGVEGIVPLEQYTPAVGDRVLLLKVGPTWFAVGSY